MGVGSLPYPFVLGGAERKNTSIFFLFLPCFHVQVGGDNYTGFRKKEKAGNELFP